MHGRTEQFTTEEIHIAWVNQKFSKKGNRARGSGDGSPPSRGKAPEGGLGS